MENQLVDGIRAKEIQILSLISNEKRALWRKVFVGILVVHNSCRVLKKVVLHNKVLY